MCFCVICSKPLLNLVQTAIHAGHIILGLAGVFLKPIFNSGLVKLGPFVQGPPFLLYHYRLPLYIRYNNHRSVTL
jgi:hypothetical protein